MTRPAIVISMAIVVLGALFVGWLAWPRLFPAPAPNVPLERNVATNTTNATTANLNRPLNANTPPATNTSTALPKEVNLSAPFTSQAPDANWDEEHEEFCEEASALMAARALQGRSIRDSADAEAALQELKQWQLDRFGYFKSTTAAEVAEMIREVYGREATLLYDPTVEDLKRELADGHFIVVPAAGRELGNPNFRQPGPLYHMLLLKGYTARGEFVTNDPGTRKGQNYVYTFDVLMSAIRDWNDGDVMNGDRVVIVVS